MAKKNDSLGDRMKGYEGVSRNFLTRRVPAIIRLDGKAFHTFTKGMEKPFDLVLTQAMQEMMKHLCENIQGCVLGYTQSDEITLVLTDYATIQTDAWFSINSTSDDQREAQFADKSLSLREIANIASDLPMPVGRKYTLNFAVTEATILDAKVLDSLFDRDKFIVKITPIHQTKAALEHNYDITTSYDDYSVYDKFEQPLLDLGWDVIVFVPSKEEDSDRITCGNALISEV